MFPSNYSWGCQQRFLPTGSEDVMQCVLPTFPEDVKQCFLPTVPEVVSNVSFQLFLKTSRNVSYPTGSEYVMQCFLPTVRDMSYYISFQLVFKTPFKVSFQLFLRCHEYFLPTGSENVMQSFLLILMQCLSLTVLIPRNICSPFDIYFMQIYIICLISDHSDVISQTYLNLFPCHSLAKVCVNHTNAHCIMRYNAYSVEQLITKCRDNRLNIKK